MQPDDSSETARTNPTLIIQGRGLSPMIWLCYLGFWFIQPFYSQGSRQWIYLGAALAVFLPLYFGSIYGKIHTRRWCALGTLALAIVYVPMNQSSFGIYFYMAWYLVNLVESDAAVFRLMALVCAVIGAQAWIFHLSSWEWSIGIGVTGLSVMNAVRLRQGEQANAKLRLAHDEITQLAKTAERERIARDLHDLLGHTLSLIVIKSELASKAFHSAAGSCGKRAARHRRDGAPSARRGAGDSQRVPQSRPWR